MSGHVSDELPLLLTGDANRDVVMTAAAHLRACDDCRLELVSAVVAHASLMSAHRFAPEIVAAAGLDEHLPARTDTAGEPADLPDLSAVFAEVRAEVSAEAHAEVAAPNTHRAARQGPRRRLRLAAVAAAAAVVVGGGTTYAVVSGDDGGPAGRTVDLAGNATARATLVGGDRMRLDASALPKLSDGRQYEVWLVRGADDKQSIGFLGGDRRAELRVPASVMKRYQRIAVSLQNEGQTEFSGRVVLTGTYPS